MCEEKYRDYSPSSEFQAVFNEGADLGFSDGKDKGFVLGAEAICALLDVDYPIEVALPSGKREFINNFPPSCPNRCDEFDKEDIKGIKDFKLNEDYHCETFQSKKKCHNCSGRYSCDLSPYSVGEYETVNILKVQNIIDELEKVSDNILGIIEEHQDRGQLGIAETFDKVYEDLRPVFQYLHLLQEDLNYEAFREYLNRIFQINALNAELNE